MRQPWTQLKSIDETPPTPSAANNVLGWYQSVDNAFAFHAYLVEPELLPEQVEAIQLRLICQYLVDGLPPSALREVFENLTNTYDFCSEPSSDGSSYVDLLQYVGGTVSYEFTDPGFSIEEIAAP